LVKISIDDGVGLLDDDKRLGLRLVWNEQLGAHGRNPPYFFLPTWPKPAIAATSDNRNEQ